MTESDWSLLLGRIEAGECTPFLGAGASAGALPLGRDGPAVGQQHGYPLEDATTSRASRSTSASARRAMFPRSLSRAS